MKGPNDKSDLPDLIDGNEWEILTTYMQHTSNW